MEIDGNEAYGYLMWLATASKSREGSPTSSHNITWVIRAKRGGLEQEKIKFEALMESFMEKLTGD